MNNVKNGKRWPPAIPMAKVGIKKHPQRVATYRATLRMQRLSACLSDYLLHQNFSKIVIISHSLFVRVILPKITVAPQRTENDPLV